MTEKLLPTLFMLYIASVTGYQIPYLKFKLCCILKNPNDVNTYIADVRGKSHITSLNRGKLEVSSDRISLIAIGWNQRPVILYLLGM